MGQEAKRKKLLREIRAKCAEPGTYKVLLDVEITCKEGLPGLMLELFRRFGQDDGFMPQDIWGPHGGAFTSEQIAKAREMVQPQIELMKLPGRCEIQCTRKGGSQSCLGDVWANGKPLCRQSPDEQQATFKMLMEMGRKMDPHEMAKALGLPDR